MKKIEFLTLLILLSVFTSISAKDVVIVKQNSGMQDPGRPRLPVLIPLTADISPTELYLHFTTAVGVTNITVTDGDGVILHSALFDTEANSELYIPVDMWNSGDYTVTISYGSIILEGKFDIL